MKPVDLEHQEIESEFVDLLVSSCRFVGSVKDVPANTLFVYGKNSPIRLQTRELYKKLDRDPSVVISVSVDTECNYEGRYVAAHESTTKLMDTQMREQNRLYFYDRAIYRVTFNSVGVHSNGQLAILMKMPTAEAVAQKHKLPLLLSPPGSSYLPGASDTEESLKTLGWKEVAIGVAPPNVVTVGRTRARRELHYGLQLYIGSTWHSTMGKTMASLATKVECGKGPYSLWDPTQVVILLSRTSLPIQTIFVSKDPVKTALILFRILKHQSPFRLYLSYLLESLCSNPLSPARPPLDNSRSIFKPRDVLLPPDNTGFVYILVSTKDLNSLYIGSCFNLIRRFTQHNSGYGALQTAPSSLRPWAILAYVCGFEAQQDRFFRFEQSWILRKQQMHASNPMSVSIEGIVSIGADLVSEFNQQFGTSLLFVKAGTLTNIFNNDAVPVVHTSSSSACSTAGDTASTSSTTEDVLAELDAADSLSIATDSVGRDADEGSDASLGEDFNGAAFVDDELLWDESDNED